MSDKIPTSREFLDALARGIAQREGLPAPASDRRLAKELGTSQQNISAIRTGRTTLGTPLMERIAEIMDVPYEWILACIQVERAQNVAARMAWQRAARKLASLAIALILFVISGVMPVQSARAAEWVGGDVNIHYAHHDPKLIRVRFVVFPGICPLHPLDQTVRIHRVNGHPAHV